MPQLIHPELSYAVRGVLLHVYNSLGPMLKEEYYQDVRLILVEDKILLATFALDETDTALIEQLKARMRQLRIKPGLLVNFHDTGLTVTPVRIK